MTETLYLDTNIYIDLFEDRTDRLRPLGEFAFQLLKRAIACEFDIVVSSLILEELFYNSYEQQVKNLLPALDEKGKIIRAEIAPEDVKAARRICQERKTPFNDTLHAILAQKMNSAYLVTRNMKDFYELQDLIKIIFPENL